MTDAFKAARPIGDLLRMLIAPMIWFLHLAIVYAAETLICLGPTAAGSTSTSTSMTGTVFLSTAVALAGLAVLAVTIVRAANKRAPDRTDTRFLRAASLFLTLISAMAVIWTALPTALLPACATATG
jgi:hypothetical protein